MAFGDKINSRVQQLQAQQSNRTTRLLTALETATREAIKVAKDLTPANAEHPVRGLNSITDEAKQGWDRDSDPVPKISGNVYTTKLANHVPHIEYVNDGHIVDKHFVPHLVINPVTGYLDKDPTNDGGIYVGTQTEYVQGLYMKERANETFKTVLAELLEEIADGRS